MNRKFHGPYQETRPNCRYILDPSLRLRLGHNGYQNPNYDNELQ